MEVSIYKLCDRAITWQLPHLLPTEPAHLHHSYITSLASMCIQPAPRAHYPPFLSPPSPSLYLLPHTAGAYMLVGLNKINKNQTWPQQTELVSSKKTPLFEVSHFLKRKDSAKHLTLWEIHTTRKCTSQQFF